MNMYLRMLAAATVVAFNLYLPAFGQRVDTAIVFLADQSDSMKEDEKQFVIDAHRRALVSEEVVSAFFRGEHRVAMAFVSFATYSYLEVDWHVIAEPVDLVNFAGKIGYRDIGSAPGYAMSQTGTSRALEMADQLFDRLPVAAERMVVDVVTDGKNNVPAPLLKDVRKRLLDRGVIINGLAVAVGQQDKSAGFNSLREELEATTLGGFGHFSVDINDMGQLPMELRRKIVQELF